MATHHHPHLPELAATLGLAERDVKQQVRLSYVKVAEWQRRGSIHFHAAIRLDTRPPAGGDPDGHEPPPARYTLPVLEHAIRAAVAHVDVTYDDKLTAPRGGRSGQGLAAEDRGCPAGTLDGTDQHPHCTQDPPQRVTPREAFETVDVLQHQVLAVDAIPQATVARWGRQVDVRPIHPTHLVAIEDQLRTTLDDTQGLSRGQIAGYLAKYATKDTEVLAQLRPNLDIWALTNLAMPDHVRRLAVCAWLQARAWPTRDERHRRMRRWTHQFGYGGHYLTKSRRYSTTFGALRQARRDWHLHRQRHQREQTAERRAENLHRDHHDGHVDAHDHTDSATDPDRYALVVEWRLQGIGWRLPGDALLARTARTQALAARAEAREQRHHERDLHAWID